MDTEKKYRNKKPAVDLSQAVLGKIPPQAKDLEEAVLGACLLEKSSFDRVIEILQPKSFYVETHQKIFGAMVSLAAKNMPIDLFTVCEELIIKEELNFVGGPYAVTRLTNSVVSSANIETHAKIVMQKFMQRELIRVGGELIGDGYDETIDVFDLLDDAERKVMEINGVVSKTIYYSVGDSALAVVSKAIELRNSDRELTGVNTGFKALNKITCGWQTPDLIILAARPSVGKTAFALNLARAACMAEVDPVAVGFFSLEMTKEQLTQRLMSAESDVWLEKISRGRLDDVELKLIEETAAKMQKMPIYIDDTAGLNIFELRAKCRRMKQKQNVGLIIIDYLQLMSGMKGSRNDNREQEISKISRELKNLTKELQVPIIALSQLSRDVEKRKEGMRMPVLSDLRESGAIEQDADIVMFMYRPEYYGENFKEGGEKMDGETHIKFAKHRSGALDTIKIRAQLTTQKFHDIEEKPEQKGLGIKFPVNDGGGNWKQISPEISNNFDDDAPF